jgi:hypothetical protein
LGLMLWIMSRDPAWAKHIILPNPKRNKQRFRAARFLGGMFLPRSG